MTNENAITAAAAVVDNTTRDTLIKKHWGFARKIAVKRQFGMPKSVQLDDLLSAAYYGLLDACGRYDKSMTEPQFRSFIRIRVIGEINDYLRKCLWGGRNNSFHNWNLDVPVHGSNCGRNPLPLSDSLSDNSAFASAEADELFLELIHPLPARIQKMFWFYYKEGKTMKEISDMPEFDVCESRVSQEMAKYQKMLARTWKHRQDELFRSANPRSKVDERFRLTSYAYKMWQKAA